MLMATKYKLCYFKCFFIVNMKHQWCTSLIRSNYFSNYDNFLEISRRLFTLLQLCVCVCMQLHTCVCAWIARIRHHRHLNMNIFNVYINTSCPCVHAYTNLFVFNYIPLNVGCTFTLTLQWHLVSNGRWILSTTICG